MDQAEVIADLKQSITTTVPQAVPVSESRIAAQLNGLDAHIDSLDVRMDNVDTKLDEILDAVGERLGEFDERLAHAA